LGIGKWSSRSSRSSGVQEFRIMLGAVLEATRKFSFEVGPYDLGIVSGHGFSVGNKEPGDLL
jgi:hypothetical protein